MLQSARRRFLQAGAGAMLAATLPGCRLFSKSNEPLISSLPQRYTVRAQNLNVHTDRRMSQKHPLIGELDKLRLQCRQQLQLPPPRDDVDVYLFKDEPTYSAYLESTWPGLPSRRAYFVGTARQLAVYSFWGDRVLEDLRHEYTHGLLHSCLREVPLWLDEGLAEYFEVPGEHPGTVNQEYAQQLSEAITNGWEPDLKRLESLNEFAQMQRVDYQEAWAWMHFMMHHTEETRAALLDYIHQLRDVIAPRPLSERLNSVLPAYAERMKSYVITLNTPGGLPFHNL